MSQPHLICYLGRNTSGKSYRANQLVETQNYVKVSMADALRELAWKTLGRVPEDYDKFKDNDIDSYYGLTGRDFLQNLGQGAKDIFGEDIWVKQWEGKVNKVLSYEEHAPHYEDGRFGCAIITKYPEMVATDDIRFPIEVESAHKLGATFVWCDYQKGNYQIEEHSSEALANRILASGKYQDGDEIPFEELKTFFD